MYTEHRLIATMPFIKHFLFCVPLHDTSYVINTNNVKFTILQYKMENVIKNWKTFSLLKHIVNIFLSFIKTFCSL